MTSEPYSAKPINAFIAIISFGSITLSYIYLPDSLIKIIILSVSGCIGVVCLMSAVWLYVTRDIKSPIFVTNKLDDSAFDISWNLGCKIYTKSLRMEYTLRSTADKWLTKYKSGVFQAWDRKGNLWGYFSMWPITQEAYELIKVGKLKENDLSESHIESLSQAPFKRWYIADILKTNAKYGGEIRKDIFSNYLTRLMIFSGLNQLFSEKQFADPVNFIAFGATPSGRKLLKLYGFTQAFDVKRSEAYYDIYLKAMSLSQLKVVLEKLKTEVSTLESKIK